MVEHQSVWRFTDVVACLANSNPVGAGFSEKYHVSPLSILGHCFDGVSLDKAFHPKMIDLDLIKMSTW